MSRGLMISPQLADEIEHILAELQRKTGATCVLLADVSGQLIGRQGTADFLDTTIFAALAAGDMAATAEMAMMVGEDRPFKMHLHEGKDFNVYLCAVENSFLLAVIFRTTVQIGLVRLFSTRAVRALLPLVEQFEALQEQPAEIVSADFGAMLAGELEEAFGGL
jgi:predicted regulator of Ras-like GTPase activity (Roadblock/LC7/MglB family)